MSVYHEMFQIETQKGITFQDMTEKILNAAAKSGVRNGLVNVYSQHTSCSVLIQEDSEDVTYNHVPLILQDMVNVLKKVIPDCNYEGQYLHPGPIHSKNAQELRQEETEWLLNTDGHLRSVLLGRSETIPLVDGEVMLGEFGRIYFADMDQTRERTRCVRVQIIGE